MPIIIFQCESDPVLFDGKTAKLLVTDIILSGNDIKKSKDLSISAETSQTTPTRTKKLFVTGMLLQFLCQTFRLQRKVYNKSIWT